MNLEKLGKGESGVVCVVCGNESVVNVVTR